MSEKSSPLSTAKPAGFMPPAWFTASRNRDFIRRRDIFAINVENAPRSAGCFPMQEGSVARDADSKGEPKHGLTETGWSDHPARASLSSTTRHIGSLLWEGFDLTSLIAR